MHKVPIGIKITLFLILTIIQVAIFNLFHHFNRDGLTFTIEGFNLIFWIITGIAMLIGICFVNLFKAWTVDDLIERMDNPIFINRTIISLYERKLQLQDKLKWEIPDPIRVSIIDFKLEKGGNKGDNK